MMSGSLRRQKGQATLEFAIAVTLFLTMVLSIFEAGRLFLEYSIVAHAAEEGARYGSMHGTSCKTVLGLPGCTATSASVKSYVTGQWPAFTVDVTWPSPADPGATVVVKVSGTFQPLFWFSAAFPTINYSNTAKMVIGQ
jgi:Flp pilus assembly protein TadG